MEIFIAIGTFAVGILLAVLFMIFFGNSRYNRSLKEAKKRQK